MVLTDASLFLGAFSLAYSIQPVAPAGWLPGPPAAAALGVGLGITVFAMSGLYRPARVAMGWFQLARIVRAWTVLMGLALVGSFSGWGQLSSFSSGLFFTIAVGSVGFVRLSFWRAWLRRRYSRFLRGARVIVGTGSLARRLGTAALSQAGWSPELVGFVDEGDDLKLEDLDDLPSSFLGGFDRVRELARENRISHVLVAREDMSRGHLVELAHQWLGDNLQVSLVSSAFEVMVVRASGALLGGVPLAELQRSPQRGWRLRVKRLLDLSAVLVGGLVLLPILAVVAVAIRITSKGPILFKQLRVGQRGKQFTLYKFRSMYADNDDRTHREYAEALIRGTLPDARKGEKRVYKLVNDPRVTPLGRFLRATSLDEFPQLWNVVKGDMSLVGPRPCLPYEWDLYEDWQRSRLDVLPGITGLWQVCGRSQVPFEEMVLLDLHYIANWSLGLDLVLLARTVPVVMNGSGAH